MSEKKTHDWQRLDDITTVEYLLKGKTIESSHVWDGSMWIYFTDGTGLELNAQGDEWIVYNSFVWEKETNESKNQSRV